MTGDRSMPPWQMTRYLRLHGWSREDGLSDEDVDVFVSPSFRDAAGEPIRLFVPLHEALEDFARMRENLVRALSELERREPRAIVREMQASQADMFSARVLLPGDDHRLLFKDLLEAYRALFDLFMAAASAEVRKPAPYFAEHPREARRFACNLLTPAPAPGSFVLQVESPLSTSLRYSRATASSAGDELPLARRVMVRVMRGLRQAPELGPNSLGDLFAHGLNANMCEALSSLHAGLHGTPVDFAVHWDPWVAVPDDVATLEPIRYEPHHFEAIHEIGGALRQPQGPRHQVIVGHVVELHAKRSALATAGEQVAFLSAEVDGRTQSLRLPLEEADYRVACTAHLERRPVRVEGVLERLGRRWQITKYKGFAMAPA